MSISSMLVPVNLDERDQKLLQYVCGLKIQSVRHVIVATAVEETGLEAPVLAAEVDRARERLASLAQSLKTQCDLTFELRVVTGDPTDAILVLAKQAGVDVICIGTEGKSTAHYLFHGSVAEDLFSSGTVRAMGVRHDLLNSVEDPGELSRGFAERLVVATDFSEAARRAFLSAFDRPTEAIGEVFVLHVGEDAGSVEAQHKLDELVAAARDRGVTASAVMRTGDPAQAALDFLREIEATGVIIGQRGEGSMFRPVFGWVPIRLLREAPCPVVIQP